MFVSLSTCSKGKVLQKAYNFPNPSESKHGGNQEEEQNHQTEEKSEDGDNEDGQGS
jgi:hypothetical protein